MLKTLDPELKGAKVDLATTFDERFVKRGRPGEAHTASAPAPKTRRPSASRHPQELAAARSKEDLGLLELPSTPSSARGIPASAARRSRAGATPTFTLRPHPEESAAGSSRRSPTRHAETPPKALMTTRGRAAGPGAHSTKAHTKAEETSTTWKSEIGIRRSRRRKAARQSPAESRRSGRRRPPRGRTVEEAHRPGPISKARANGQDARSAERLSPIVEALTAAPSHASLDPADPPIRPPRRGAPSPAP